jgi:hypothetical protein
MSDTHALPWASRISRQLAASFIFRYWEINQYNLIADDEKEKQLKREDRASIVACNSAAFTQYWEEEVPAAPGKESCNSSALRSAVRWERFYSMP